MKKGKYFISKIFDLNFIEVLPRQICLVYRFFCETIKLCAFWFACVLINFDVRLYTERLNVHIWNHKQNFLAFYIFVFALGWKFYWTHFHNFWNGSLALKSIIWLKELWLKVNFISIEMIRAPKKRLTELSKGLSYSAFVLNCCDFFLSAKVRIKSAPYLLHTIVIKRKEK